jgi:hypothetical protein
LIATIFRVLAGSRPRFGLSKVVDKQKKFGARISINGVIQIDQRALGS